MFFYFYYLIHFRLCRFVVIAVAFDVLFVCFSSDVVGFLIVFGVRFVLVFVVVCAVQ